MEVDKIKCIKNTKELLKSLLDKTTLKKFEDNLINESLIKYYDIISIFKFNGNTLHNRNEMIKTLFLFNVKSEYRKILYDTYCRFEYKYNIDKSIDPIEFITKKFNKYSSKSNTLLLKSLNDKYN